MSNITFALPLRVFSQYVDKMNEEAAHVGIAFGYTHSHVHADDFFIQP